MMLRLGARCATTGADRGGYELSADTLTTHGVIVGMTGLVEQPLGDTTHIRIVTGVCRCLLRWTVRHSQRVFGVEVGRARRTEATQT